MAEIAAELAEQAALRSLVGDLLFCLALVDPEPITRLRDHARHLLDGARLGMLEARPGQDVETFHAARHEILEAVCARAGFPHRSADVIPLRPAD